MNSKHSALFLVWMAVLFADQATFGQPTGNPRTSAPMVAAPAAPMITILAAATGPLVRSLGAGNASLDLGRVSYFQEASAPGQSVQKSSRKCAAPALRSRMQQLGRAAAPAPVRRWPAHVPDATTNWLETNL